MSPIERDPQTSDTTKDREVLKRLMSAAPERRSRIPAIAEFSTKDGRYYLSQIFTEEHFVYETNWLKHCLGNRKLPHMMGYQEKVREGERAIFSLREQWPRGGGDDHSIAKMRRDMLMRGVKLYPGETTRILAATMKRANIPELSAGIGNSDIVSDKMLLDLKGGIDIPVATIEYDPETKTILQIKTFRTVKNQYIERKDPYFCAVLEAIQFLRSGSTYHVDGSEYTRGAKFLHRSERPFIPEKDMLLVDGRIVDQNSALSGPPEDISGGFLRVTADMPKEKITYLASHASVDLDMTNATDEQRAGLIDIDGYVIDNSSVCEYPSLIEVNGDVKFPRAHRVSTPRLVRVWGTYNIHLATEADTRSLFRVSGDIDASSLLDADFPNLCFVTKSMTLEKTKRLHAPKLTVYGSGIRCNKDAELLIPEKTKGKVLRIPVTR